ncbi:MAG TPA: ankyrin repeat domain-containing protein [Gammaproteobacteria bacterium]
MTTTSKPRIKYFLFAIAGPAILGIAFLVLYESEYLPSAQGTVRDAAGNPTAGAIVFSVQQVVEKQTWNFHGYSRRRCARVGATITDANGHFDLDGGRVSIPKGWDFETINVQYHVIAKGFRSTTVGDRLELSGIGERSAEQAIGTDGRVNAVLEAASTDLFISPWFVEALQYCESMNADLTPAYQGFRKVFEDANPKSESIHQRKWLNVVGNIALRARFSADELPESSQPLTNEIIRELLSGDTDPAFAQIALRQAVIANDVDRIRQLLRTGIDVNFDDGYRYSRRALALDHESHDAYRLLRENGARWRDGEAQQLLYLLAQRGDTAGVEILASEGVRADVFVEGGQSVAFMEAVAGGHADVLQIMLSRNLVADIDAAYGDQENALQKAFARNQLQAFRVLLSFGANSDITDKHGRSLFENAVLSRPDFALVMLEHGAFVQTDSRGRNLLTSAIYRDNRILAEAMLKAGFTPAAEHSTAPLAAAAGKGWQDMVHRMLQHPDTPPGSNAWWSALSIAVTRNRAMVDYLLDSYDAPLSNPPPKSGCASCRAAADGKLGIIRQLLARGLPVDVRNSTGETALMYAARNGQLETAKFLLENGAALSLVDENGISALAYAADGGNHEDRKRRLHSGFSAATSGQSPSHDTVRSAKAGKKTVTFKPVDLADRPSHEAPPEVVSVTMLSPSSTARAVRMERRREKACVVVPEMVALLLHEGANPNAVDENGWSALMRAADCGEASIVEMLLANGADRKLKNLQGKTAADIAEGAGHAAIAATLR